MFMINNKKLLLTAGGKIVCHQCQATSKRTKLQCGRPASRGKAVCNFHGGKSTGPKTPDGKERSRQANFKFGEYTQHSMRQDNRALLNLTYMEDLMHLLKMTSADRTRGPKPLGYIRYTSSSQLLLAIEENNKTLG
jgi:hypothetical protein